MRRREEGGGEGEVEGQVRVREDREAGADGPYLSAAAQVNWQLTIVSPQLHVNHQEGRTGLILTDFH